LRGGEAPLEEERRFKSRPMADVTVALVITP
jgi:hypothetical protein